MPVTCVQDFLQYVPSHSFSGGYYSFIELQAHIDLSAASPVTPREGLRARREPGQNNITLGYPQAWFHIATNIRSIKVCVYCLH